MRNVSKYKLIWIDSNINSTENFERQINFKNLIENLFVFQNFSDAQQLIKEIKNEKIFIILNGNDNHYYEFILNIHLRPPIASIYVYSQLVQSTRFLLRPIAKVC